jgi:hypothetical protein
VQKTNHLLLGEVYQKFYEKSMKIRSYPHPFKITIFQKAVQTYYSQNVIITPCPPPTIGTENLRNRNGRRRAGCLGWKGLSPIKNVNIPYFNSKFTFFLTKKVN